MNERLHVLDGLRGWAAFIVMLLHVFYQILPPVGISELRFEDWWPFTGKFSVALFFIVSGYSLSIGFLRTGQNTVLYRMALGRYLRLIIPVFGACALMSLFMNLGLVPAIEARPATLDGLFLFEPTLMHLLEFGLVDVIFDFHVAESYAPPLWTISYEFFGSMMVAAMLLFLGMPSGRPLAYVALTALLFVYLPWFFLFAAGVLAAGMHTKWSEHVTSRLALLLIVAGCILSVLSREFPHMLVFAAFLFFVGALHFPWTCRFLSTRFSRSLGEISFPLYLLHVPITVAVGLPIYMVDPDSFLHTASAAFLGAAASMVASVMFMPVNSLSIYSGRRFGAWLTALVTGGNLRAGTRAG